MWQYFGVLALYSTCIKRNFRCIFHQVVAVLAVDLWSLVFCLCVVESPPTQSAEVKGGVWLWAFRAKPCVIKPVYACCFPLFNRVRVAVCVVHRERGERVREDREVGIWDTAGRILKQNTKQIWMKVALFTGYEILCASPHFKALPSY